MIFEPNLCQDMILKTECQTLINQTIVNLTRAQQAAAATALIIAIILIILEFSNIKNKEKILVPALITMASCLTAILFF